MVPDLESDPSGRGSDPTFPPVLFLVVLGGRVPGVHIELHDVHQVACLEGWHVRLRPVDTAPPPLVPDWFAYRPI
jgi:hypothetical protein